ncbi:MAG: CBS domain-containing protein [Myxococcales bacterium]
MSAAFRYSDIDACIQLPRATVAELMSRNVLCVRPELSLDALANLFEQTGWHAAAVVNERDQTLVVLDERTVLRALQHGDVRGTPTRERSVAELIERDAITVQEHLPATQAAGLMVYEAVERVAVVSGTGKVVGVLSAADLLRWVARSDGHVVPECS